ncbi:MAG: hypothetical protein KC592_00780 [Nitrospira sp.]|nr:hypothetical protein [Nitrospira sp.]
MRDYLDRLVRRVQQPEFVVQPRPISRFESPSQLILEPSNPFAAGEPNESRAQSDHFIPHETSGYQPRPPTDSLPQHDPEIVIPTSEAPQFEHSIHEETGADQPRHARNGLPHHTSKSGISTSAAHKPYPAGQLMTGQSQVTDTGRTEAAHHPGQEILDNPLLQPYISQGQTIGRKEKKPIEPVVQIEKAARAVGMPSSNSARAGKPSKLNPRMVQRIPDRTYRFAEIEEQANPLGIPVSDVVGIQEHAKLKEPGSLEEQEWVRSRVKIGKPEGKSASPLSTRMTSPRELGIDDTCSVIEPLFHRKPDLMPILDAAHVPGREQIKSFAENRASQFPKESITESPTIQVTIGRVEIRATVASTPTRKPPVKSSAMSLDEYLSRRNEGRR